MGYPSIDEIATAAKNWDFVKKLPSAVDSFQKSEKGTIDGKILTICSYYDDALKAGVDIIYTSETFDYILVRKIGLNVYRDIRFIYKEKEEFAKKVAEALPQVLKETANPNLVNLGEMVKDHKILTWEYGNSLPETLENFTLYIKPQNAIEYLNGSIILLDYSNFSRQDQFVIYYNRFRNEFFGEVKIGSVFHATKKYDSKTLGKLETLLKTNLPTTLEKISKADHSI